MFKNSKYINFMETLKVNTLKIQWNEDCLSKSHIKSLELFYVTDEKFPVFDWSFFHTTISFWKHHSAMIAHFDVFDVFNYYNLFINTTWHLQIDNFVGKFCLQKLFAQGPLKRLLLRERFPILLNPLLLFSYVHSSSV